METYDKQVNEYVQQLIIGGMVFIKDKQQRKDVQNKLREIKKNCIEVLKQMKEANW